MLFHQGSLYMSIPAEASSKGNSHPAAPHIMPACVAGLLLYLKMPAAFYHSNLLYIAASPEADIVGLPAKAAPAGILPGHGSLLSSAPPGLPADF